MFIYESSFSVCPLKNRLRELRHQGQCYQHNYTVQTFKSGYQTVNVWSGFSAHGRTPLVCIVVSFNQHTYRFIIDTHLIPFMNEEHDGPASFILHGDNCGPLRARSIATYLQNKEVTRMVRPSQSPDLNCIENIWGLPKTYLRKQASYPKNCNELFATLSNMWHSLPDSYFHNLTASMTMRVKMVKLNKGRSTKY